MTLFIFSRASLRRRLVLDPAHVLVDFELALAPGVVHVAHLPEHRALLPALVVHAPDGPRDAHEPVAVAPVQRVRVVQTQRDGKRLVRTAGGPLQNLLRPVHAHETVHPAQRREFRLRGVPQLVVRPRVLQLLFRVRGVAHVAGVQLQALQRPPRSHAAKRVVLGRVQTEVLGELATHDELLEERRRRLRQRVRVVFVRVCSF